MTQREIARLACKVLAIWTVIDGLKYLQTSARSFSMLIESWSQVWHEWSSMLSIGLSILIPFVQIGMGIWLWTRAGVVAAWMTGHNLQDEQDEQDVVRVPADLDAVQSVVLSTMGVWVLIEVVPVMVGQLATLLPILDSGRSEMDVIANRTAALTIVWIILRLAIGIWLIFGSPGIVRMLKRFRQTGTQPASNGQ